MKHQPYTAWIFTLLVLTILFMALFPTQTIIGLGIIFMPILVLLQAYVILRAPKPEELPSPEDQWYES